MPRKVKNIDNNINIPEKKTKKNLLNTIVKNINKDEHIVLHLPINKEQIDKIINNDNILYTNEPIPYERNCYYLDNNIDIKNDENVLNYSEKKNDILDIENKNICCFWCCNKIDYNIYGMPINYDTINDTYKLYGSFCSLQCANAFNFSVHNGSDKLWEINSLIQMISKKYGFKDFIRPAPSKYILKMFGGELDISEYRKLHKNNETTHVINLPPMISISSGYEVVNTSYIAPNTNFKKE